MADIISFGKNRLEEEKDITVEKLFEDILKEHKLRSVVIIGVLEDGDSIMVSGNTTVSQSVYLMEVGKNIVINNQS